MSIHRLQVTAGPSESAPVLCDLATDEVAAQSDGFDLGSPDTAFGLDGRPVEESREPTIPLLILFVVAGKQLVSGIMQGAVKG